jgi:hypothetical protein
MLKFREILSLKISPEFLSDSWQCWSKDRELPTTSSFCVEQFALKFVFMWNLSVYLGVTRDLKNYFRVSSM